MRQAWCQRGTFGLAVALAFTAACVTSAPRRPAGVEGTFVGTTADHRPVHLTLRPARSGFVGVGEWDGRPVSLSFLAGVRGTGLVVVDEHLVPFEAELSFDGDRLLLDLEGETLELERGGGARAPSGGDLAGRFVAGGRRDYRGEMTLAQDGRLIFGTGLLFGRRFAVAGVTDGAGKFDGRVLYADGSEAALSAELAAGGRRLQVFGLGVPLEMVRRGGGEAP